MKKQLNLSDLKKIRGGAAIAKWTKSDETETPDVKGLPTCKCYTETKGAASGT